LVWLHTKGSKAWLIGTGNCLPLKINGDNASAQMDTPATFAEIISIRGSLNPVTKADLAGGTRETDTNGWTIQQNLVRQKMGILGVGNG